MALYAFNGTWNAEKTDDLATAGRETDLNTNVIRFREAYRHPGIFYRNGVGTRLSWIGKRAGATETSASMRSRPRAAARCIVEDAVAELSTPRSALFLG